MKLFEYAIIHLPSKEDKKDGAKSSIIVAPKAILAKDEKHANMLAATAIPADFHDSLDEVYVVVRPF